MLIIEFRKFWEEEIQSRWDGWFVSEKVFEDWFKAFRNCDSEKLALAISKWFRDNEPKKPTIPKAKAMGMPTNARNRKTIRPTINMSVGAKLVPPFHN